MAGCVRSNGGTILTGNTKILGQKPLSVSLCPPQISHVLTWVLTGSSAVTGSDQDLCVTAMTSTRKSQSTWARKDTWSRATYCVDMGHSCCTRGKGHVDMGHSCCTAGNGHADMGHSCCTGGNGHMDAGHSCCTGGNGHVDTGHSCCTGGNGHWSLI